MNAILFTASIRQDVAPVNKISKKYMSSGGLFLTNDN